MMTTMTFGSWTIQF